MWLTLTTRNLLHLLKFTAFIEDKKVILLQTKHVWNFTVSNIRQSHVIQKVSYQNENMDLLRIESVIFLSVRKRDAGPIPFADINQLNTI